MRFEVSDLRRGYTAIGRTLLQEGELTRNRRTRSQLLELLGVVIVLSNPRDALPVGVDRKLNLGIGAIEALQLIGGWSDPELTCRVAPGMRQFRDAGVFHGAYGLRLRNQLPRVVERLRRDPTSRQAVVTIWDPLHDGDDGVEDLPCTVSLQWLIRQDKLHAVTYMRSNDFWWGLAYDAFQFTQLQLTLAALLGLQVGTYFHHVGSFHAYERDWAGIDALRTEPLVVKPIAASGIDHGCFAWRHVRQVTRDIVQLPRAQFEQDYAWDPSLTWYRDVLEPHL